MPHHGLRFADGTVQTSAAEAASNVWLLGGNAGTAPGTHFLGTADETPFEVHVDGRRAMRFEPGSTPNVIGGHGGNVVDAGIVGATISGGGVASSANRVLANFGTVGGGSQNTASATATVGGGRQNTASGFSATVGGGINNMANGLDATVGGGSNNTAAGERTSIGGGFQNTASGFRATVGGGDSNSASGNFATVGGGEGNWASGNFATVPGGRNNMASGVSSFAAGTRAHAIHASTFVWSDGSADLSSPNSGTFNIRATNGVRMHHGFVQTTTWPIRIHNPNTSLVAGMRLTNEGFFDVTNHAPATSGFARLNTGGSWTAVSDRRLKTDITPADNLLAGVMQLQPARYQYRDDASGTVHLGLIAQEVQAVFPEFVTEGEILTLDYAGLSAVALGAIREQQARIDVLEAENAAMNERLQRLERMFSVAN